MSIPQTPGDKTGIDAGTDSSPTTDALQPPVELKEKHKSWDEGSNPMDDADAGPEPHGQGANGHAEGNAEYRYSSSSTSQPGSRGSSGDTEYGEGEIEDFPYDDEFEDEDKSFVSDLRGGGKGIRSARTSISSLPGSVVVYPNGKPKGNAQFQRGDFRQSIDTLDRNPTDSPFCGNRVRSKKVAKNGRYSCVPQVRDMDSPFRHPSSVRALQMGDEDYYDNGGIDDGNFFSSPVPRNGRMGGHSHRSSRMSDISFRSSPMSPDQRSYHTSPPQAIQPSKEYALVLLHCTLLPPSFPLSLPPGSPLPSKELLREILPDAYWTRWKLLEEKIGTTGILRDRGILISHPQEAYDLLEERLLETLSLTRPRLAYGHFIGGDDTDEDEDEQTTDDDDENNDEKGGCVKKKCQDCGQRVVNNRDGLEKKWEVRVYAANGLMGQGAWAAAWKEMEKVDVEVGLCLPAKLKNELEQRLVQEQALRRERMTEDAISVENSHPTTKAPVNPPGRPQSQIDGLYEPPREKAAVKVPIRKGERPALTTAPTQYSRDDINLLKALYNYIRIVCQGNQLLIVTILLVLLALLTPSPYSFFGRLSSDINSSRPDPFLSAQPSIIPVPSSHMTIVSQPPINSIDVVQSSSAEIQHVSTVSYALSSSVETAPSLLDPQPLYPGSQEDEKVSTQLESSLHDEPLSQTQSTLPASCYEQQEDLTISAQSESPTFLAPPALSDAPAPIVQSSPLPSPSRSSYAALSASSALPPIECGERPAEDPEYIPSPMSQVHTPASSSAAAPGTGVASEELHESASTPPSISHSPCPTPTSAAMGEETELLLGLVSEEENVQALDAGSKPSTG
ncbi:hypothetical protein MferCBS31731_000417 [Microsporum ferrugineum]